MRGQDWWKWEKKVDSAEDSFRATIPAFPELKDSAYHPTRRWRISLAFSSDKEALPLSYQQQRSSRGTSLPNIPLSIELDDDGQNPKELDFLIRTTE